MACVKRFGRVSKFDRIKLRIPLILLRILALRLELVVVNRQAIFLIGSVLFGVKLVIR